MLLWEDHDSLVQRASALPFMSRMALGRTLRFSEPQFFHLGSKDESTSKIIIRIKCIMSGKCSLYYKILYKKDIIPFVTIYKVGVTEYSR